VDQLNKGKAMNFERATDAMMAVNRLDIRLGSLLSPEMDKGLEDAAYLLTVVQSFIQSWERTRALELDPTVDRDDIRNDREVAITALVTKLTAQ
jgi:hypothetical protein